MGAGLLTGGSIVLRRKFSATQFWEEVCAEGCTMFVYIGELCRYLNNCPENPDERSHKLRLAFGMGVKEADAIVAEVSTKVYRLVLKRALGDAYRQVSDLKVKELLDRRYDRLQSYGRFTDTKANAK
jgi:hypothetical protein